MSLFFKLPLYIQNSVTATSTYLLQTLVKELKKKLDAARTALATKHREMKNTVAAAEEEETVILTRTDSRGFVRPIQQFGQHVKPVGGRRRKQKMETHAEGKRARYYADDDKYSLRHLVSFLDWFVISIVIC
jgi:hypothetical protein